MKQRRNMFLSKGAKIHKHVLVLVWLQIYYDDKIANVTRFKIKKESIDTFDLNLICSHVQRR